MIQFNKTIFQITKRLALAVMLIGISNPIWAGDVRTTFGTLTATPNPNSGENLIYLSTEKVNDVSNISYKSGIQQQDVNGNSIWFVWDWGNTTYTETTVYCYADSLGMSEGLWAGWYDETNKIIGNGEAFVEYVFTPTARNSGSWDNGNDPSRTNYTQAAITAKWVKPSVVGISAFKAFPTVTDKNNYTTTREVSFNVQDVTKTEHIDLITTEKGDFDVSDVTLTTSTENIFNATATITVGYKPTGIHTVSPKDELIHTGEVVLKNALYEGTYDNPASTSYKKVIFQVEEDYTPVFTTEHSTLDDALSLGETTTGQFAGISLESESGKLQPKVENRNYAAKAPLWSGDIDVAKQEKTTWKATIKPVEGYENYVDLFTFGTDNNDNPITVVNTDNPTVTFTPTTALSSFVASQANETYTFYAKIEYP